MGIIIPSSGGGRQLDRGARLAETPATGWGAVDWPAGVRAHNSGVLPSVGGGEGNAHVLAARRTPPRPCTSSVVR